MTSHTQKQLDLLRSDDHAAYEEVFRTYYLSLIVFANSFLADPPTSQDLVQDVFVKLWEQRKQQNTILSFKAYIYQSVKNACLNHLEKNKTRERHHQIIKEQSPEFIDHDEIEGAEATLHIHKAIENLPPQCRRIFKMSRFEGKKNAEIATELQLSKRTIETQISKALKQLRLTLTP